MGVAWPKYTFTASPIIASPSRICRIRIAAASSKKDTIIRRKLLRGAHEWIGADALMRSLMVWMLSARKISRSCRFVIMRVFDGGVGIAKGGIPERSIDIGVLDSLEVGVDAGELSEDIVIVCLKPSL